MGHRTHDLQSVVGVAVGLDQYGLGFAVFLGFFGAAFFTGGGADFLAISPDL